jgi:hypothetical protein
MTATTQLDDLLDFAAVRLDINLRDGYTQGYERELADDLIARLGVRERDEALRRLLHEWVGCQVAGLSLLDECDARTYDLQQRHALELYGLIVVQESQDHALRELVTGEIDMRATMLARR